MFFELSKIAWFLLAPSNALWVLASVGLVLSFTRWRRIGRVLSVLAIVSIGLVGLTPLATRLLGVLEDRFPVWDARGRTPHGIIVLGGASDPLVSHHRGRPALNESAERLTEAVALARRYPEARIVFAGGDNVLLDQPGNESEDARRVFESLGLSLDRVTFERESRNTWENAVFLRRLVEPRPGELWLLVTSAAHMPRSMGIFRSIGFPVEAYPVDHRTTGSNDIRGFVTVSDGLRRFDVAVREVVGLVAYRLTGRTSALFPAP